MLKECLSEAEIAWVVADAFRGFVECCTAVSRIIEFPRQAIRRHEFSAIGAYIRELRSEKYDYCIDYQGLLRSGLTSFVSRSPVRYGFAAGREGSPLFYTTAIKTPQEIQHAVEKNLYLTREFLRREFGLSPAESPSRIAFDVPQTEREAALAMLPSGEGPILAVGFSSTWPSKNWPLPFFSDVIHKTAERVPGLRCWLLGNAAEQGMGEELMSMLDGVNAVNLAGRTTLRGLCALLRASGALLTNDSGPMHIGAMLCTPCTALFGATNPKLTGPYGICGQAHRVITSKCCKSPCFTRLCQLPGGCCSDGINADSVAAALASDLLKQHQ